MDICLDHMDLQTRSLAITILRQDAKETNSDSKEKQDLFDYDSKVALDTYLADLESQTTVVSDRAMAKSIVQAVHHDEGIIAAAMHHRSKPTATEGQPCTSTRMATFPEIRSTRSLMTIQTLTTSAAPNSRKSTTCAFETTNEDDDHIYPRRPAKIRPCLICGEKLQFNDLARLPCSHEYCRGCLKDLFTMCLADETL